MKKNNNVIRNFLCVICAATFICSVSYMLYLEYNEYKEKKIFEELKTEVGEAQRHVEKKIGEQMVQAVKVVKMQNEVVEQEEKKTKIGEKGISEEIEKTETELTILPAYKELYEKNDDLYGWIKIEGTKIDYPVMHTPDNPNFYIHKDWYKEESTLGSIYVDGRCEEDTENLIIYGHNMKNRTMFGSLREYKEKSYFENHKYIEFNTIYEEAKYEIVAVSKAIIYYDEEPPEGEYLFYEHVELDSKQEFDAYIQNAMKKTYYKTGNTAEYGDQLITLCTCDYWTENARLIIIAKKV